MSLVVTEHVYEPDDHLYRVVVGEEVYEDRGVFDEAGEPVLDADGEQVVEPFLVGVVPVEDFVFAGQDDRWAGMDDAAIAQTQLAQIRTALAEREQATDTAVTSREMPGTGERL